MTPRRHAGSQDSLAKSIAREVQARLPVEDSPAALTASVEGALLGEARVNELTLAYFRAAALAAVTLVALLGTLDPALVGATAVPVGATVGVALCMVAAVVFLLTLRSGWYDPRLRQLVPVADALLILVPVLLFTRGAEEGANGAAFPGVNALVAVACAFLVFSGSIRLSRSAQRLATVLGITVWLGMSLALGTPVVLSLAAAIVLGVLGLLGTRFTSMVRGLVATEVRGDRLGGLYQDARSAIDAREEVLRMVAHDLRNPLSTIVMTADLLRELPVDDEGRKRHLSVITRCSDSMNRLIHDLLDVARMEAGRLQVDPVPAQAEELLDRVVELMRPIAEQHDVRLRISAGADLPPVLVDEDRVLQVFSNLIGNAIKFTPEGGSVTVRAEHVGDAVRFGVLDTGPGIPPERAARIFERFWQANTGDRRGIGLGLAIARSIIEAHGQRIGVDSPPDGGSEFWFTAAVAAEVRDPAGDRFPDRRVAG